MTEELSMEAVGPISVDYYVGQRVKEVKVNDNPHQGEPVWTIVFEGGARVYNYDSTVPTPRAIVGAGLTMVILTQRDGTELRFGLEKVLLNPMEYAMQDENHTKGKVVFPQHSNVTLAQRAERNRPADPSDERVEQGPDGGPEVIEHVETDDDVLYPPPPEIVLPEPDEDEA